MRPRRYTTCVFMCACSVCFWISEHVYGAVELNKLSVSLCFWHTDALLICVCVSIFSYLLVPLWFQRWINVWTQSCGHCFITSGSLCSINSLTAWFHFTWLLPSLSDVKMKTTSFVVHLPVAVFIFFNLQNRTAQRACFYLNEKRQIGLML